MFPSLVSCDRVTESVSVDELEHQYYYDTNSIIIVLVHTNTTS